MRKLLNYDTYLIKILAALSLIVGFSGISCGANFTINSTADSNDNSPGDGVCADTGGNCTLRAAIQESNALPAVSGGNTIIFGAVGQSVINLTLGALVVNSDINIFGSGARQVIVQRSTAPGTPNFRIFSIFAVPPRITPVFVNINKITIANGATNNSGGGLYVSTNCVLTLFEVNVKNNIAVNSLGGGIRSDGTVNIINSLITDNSAVQGGGINNQQGSGTSIDNSTITNNRAVGTPASGIPGTGGGIMNLTQITLNNVTISRNTSTDNVGGIFTSGGNNCRIRNTIIADNTAPNNSDLQGFFTTLGNNFIGNNGGATFSLPVGNPNADGDRVGTSAAPLNPLLGLLRNNGGQTDTLGLLPGSSAMDSGNNCVIDRSCATSNPIIPIISDQRGENFNRRIGITVDIGAFERQVNDISGSTFFDFDGDGKADISVFRPSNGIWYLQQSSAGFGGLQFGASSDKLVPADYDGDGKTDVAVYRDGTWYIQRSSLGFINIQFGETSDVPVPADFDEDGKTDVAVYRASNGTWYMQRSTQGFTALQFGSSGDKPVAADFDGDGKSDLAVFRPSTGIWYVQQSTAGFGSLQFGSADDQLVVADYDGDGKADFAVFRPSNGFWYLQRSTAGFTGVQFGQAGDLSVPADYDGDGKVDIGVYRNDTWLIRRSTQGFTGVQFGSSGDKPAPGAFVK